MANNPSSQFLRVTLGSVDDSGQQQKLQLVGLDGQNIGDSVRAQHFGLSSVPPAGSEGLALALGGGMDRVHVLGMEHPQKRPTNQPGGSTVLYDAAGNAVSIVGGNLRIVHSAKVSIVAPIIELVGTVTLGGAAGSGVPAAKQGTLDTAGNADTSNLATKVNVV
jgi:phage gp45-like